MIYLTCTLVITTLSMVLTVLVLNIYGTADHPVPVWIRDFVLIFIARTLGMCDTARTYQEAKDVALPGGLTGTYRDLLLPTRRPRTLPYQEDFADSPGLAGIYHGRRPRTWPYQKNLPGVTDTY